MRAIFKIKNTDAFAIKMVRRAFGLLEYTGGDVHAAKSVPEDLNARLYRAVRDHYGKKDCEHAQLWESFTKLGVNPADVTYPALNEEYPFYPGFFRIVPVMPAGTAVTTSDRDDAARRWDSLISKALAAPEMAGSLHDSYRFKSREARMFQVIVSTSGFEEYLSRSKLTTHLLDSWVQEVALQDNAFKFRMISHLADEVARSINISGDCSDRAQAARYAKLVVEVYRALERVNVSPEYVQSNEMSFDLWKASSIDTFEAMQMPLEMRAEVARSSLQVGSTFFAAKGLSGLLHAPDAFTGVLRDEDLSAQEAHRLLSLCFDSFTVTRAAEGPVQPLLDLIAAYDKEFIKAGYGSICGTETIKGLYRHLELAERLHDMGLLKGESNLVHSSFASRYPNENLDDKAGYEQRALDLAIKTGQKSLLEHEVDHYLTQNKLNRFDKRQLVSILESGILDLKSVLRTPKRIEKAIDLGVDSELLLSVPGLLNAQSRRSLVSRDFAL